MTATISSAITAIVLNFLLVPAFGILGRRLRDSLGLVVSNVLSLLFVRRYLGFWPYSNRYLKPLLAALVGAAAVVLARFLLPGYTGFTALVAFTPLFIAVFTALLVAFGLSLSDRQFLASFWLAVRRNLRWSSGD